MKKERDPLERYFHKRITAIIQEMKAPASERSHETFHRLRVEIKKIRALYALVDFTNKKFKENRSFEPFKALYKRAGVVRALQLEEKFIIRYSKELNTSRLITALKAKQKTAIGNFEKETGKKSIKEIGNREKKLKSYLKSIKEKQLQDYNKYAVKRISNLSLKEFKKEELHEIRKQFKEFLYNLRLSVPQANKLIKAIDHLQELIGEWHDNDAASIYLKKVIESEDVSKSQVTRINNVLESISFQKGKLFKKINLSRMTLKKLIN